MKKKLILDRRTDQKQSTFLPYIYIRRYNACTIANQSTRYIYSTNIINKQPNKLYSNRATYTYIEYKTYYIYRETRLKIRIINTSYNLSQCFRTSKPNTWLPMSQRICLSLQYNIHKQNVIIIKGTKRMFYLVKLIDKICSEIINVYNHMHIRIAINCFPHVPHLRALYTSC
jgi:hypothetical protein